MTEEPEDDIYCPQCDTLCVYATSIGNYCPNKRCSVSDNLEGIEYDDFYFAVESMQTESKDVEYLWYELGCMKVSLAKLEKRARNIKTSQDALEFAQGFIKFTEVYIENKWR